MRDPKFMRIDENSFRRHETGRQLDYRRGVKLDWFEEATNG
jgi:hypothetical protein